MRAALTRKLLELLEALVHGLVRIGNVALEQLGVDGTQWVVEPLLPPVYPVGRRGPQVEERLEVSHHFLQVIVLKKTVYTSRSEDSLCFDSSSSRDRLSSTYVCDWKAEQTFSGIQGLSRGDRLPERLAGASYLNGHLVGLVDVAEVCEAAHLHLED